MDIRDIHIKIRNSILENQGIKLIRGVVDFILIHSRPYFHFSDLWLIKVVTNQIWKFVYEYTCESWDVVENKAFGVMSSYEEIKIKWRICVQIIEHRCNVKLTMTVEFESIEMLM